MVWDARNAGVDVRDVVDGGLAKVLDLVTPQAMVAVASTSTSDLDDLVALAAGTQCPLLILVGLSDPGNVGTLLRTAEATGCVGMVLTEGSADIFNPKTVRASAGSLFRVPVSQGAELGSVLGACESHGVPTWATVVAGGVTLEEAELGGAGALLVGGEAHGLEAAVVDASSVPLSIPMEGQIESLNAGVAGAVVLFEAARQRRAK
ncbi:MAG TPA: RNA methyltransferase [Microthrixaceae bacterium]|nr:RNA methyltransferase [Microthrixaceae bacterium]